MGEKELFNFGDKELNLNSLLNNITSNQQSYLDYYSTSFSDPTAFIEKINYLKDGIKNGTITTDGTGIYYDKLGKLSKDDKLMNNALHFIDTIAREQSKQTRSLTRSEIEEKQRKKQEQVKAQQQLANTPENQKLNFDSEHPFNFEYAFKSQFGPTLEIPYSSLKKSIVKGSDGSEDYSTVNSHFKKAFDSMRNTLNQYNNSEEYVNQVNDLETALLDGVWDYNDELAIHKAGLTRDLDNLKDLFTYKFQEYNPRQNYKQQLQQVVNPGDFTVVDGNPKTIIYLDENGKQIKETITDDEYYKLSGTTPPAPEQNSNLEESLKDYEEDEIGWEILGPIGLDIVSIINPEPVSATIAGLGSDIFSIWQDIRNGGEFHWGQHGFNLGATALGAIPYIGDVGNVGKVGAKIVNASIQLNKQLSKAADILKKISKYHVMVGGATVGALAAMDLTAEDSLILEAGQKAVEAIENGEITKENIAAVGNGLAIAFQLRKGLKKFRNLDPNMPKSTKPTKSTKSTSTAQSGSGYRDKLIERIKTKNTSISQEDLNEINNALDQLTNKGMLTKVRQKMGGTNKELIAARQVLRNKGNFTETEIDDIIKQVLSYAKGGIIKASGGVKTPWRLNFDGTSHQMDTIYQAFVQNKQSYDAKQLAESLNQLNSTQFESLNFTGKDNTLGFKDWNTTFNASGLNNLFGYDENKSDYLGVTTKSRNNFVDYLKKQESITTGNGTLSWNPESNQWEYADWTDPNKSPDASAGTETTENGTQSTVEIPEVTDLTLKELNLRKAPNFNPNGILNSVVGYVANEAANDKKREIQKQIPVYQKVDAPEKAFKTAYTYDLEKSKSELEAEAHNIQPITSDVNAFYAARNEAIKNARAYTTKIDTEINNRVHEVNDANADIAYENAVNRTTTANENAKYRHDWTVEQLQGEADFVQAANASFQNLNKEIKHTLVTAANEAQTKRDAYVNTHILAGLKINPSNYIDGWTKHHDLIWYKGQNGELETDAERAEYQQLLAVVNQASGSLFAQYKNINYPGMNVLHVNKYFKQDYDPSKHGNTAIRGKRGAKIDKQKIGNFIKKLK